MKIKNIISQIRRDFIAIYQCEFCDYEYEGRGYDDSHFHNEVIPEKKCPVCNQKASDGDGYKPLKPKYDDSVTI